jgi:hypothetical protein
MTKDELRKIRSGAAVVAWVDGEHLPAISATLVGNYAESVGMDGKPVFRLEVKDFAGSTYHCPIELVEIDIHGDH